MSTRFNYAHLRAYAIGYYDGRAHGEAKNPYIHELPDLRHLYRRGCDAGLADYCEIELPPEPADAS